MHLVEGKGKKLGLFRLIEDFSIVLVLVIGKEGGREREVLPSQGTYTISRHGGNIT